MRGGDDTCKQLMGLLEALGTGVLLVDPEERIRLANRRAAEIFGVPSESLVSQPLSAHLAPIASLRARIASTGPTERASIAIAPPGRTPIVAGFTLNEAHVEGTGGVHYAIAFQDITPITRLQEERDRLLQLATVGEVLPSVLHEAKNPLSAAITAIEVMIEEATHHDERADLHAVLVELRRAVLTLDGLGSAGLDPHASTPRALDHAVREVASVLSPRAQRLNIELRVDVPDLPLLPLDPSVIRAVVFNLVNNALQACRGGDTVTVAARLANSTLEVSVGDTGAGMAPDVRARCTELFFTTKRSGSGIGLALCSEVAAKAGGRLEIESRLGAGTTVRLFLPITARSAASAHRPLMSER